MTTCNDYRAPAWAVDSGASYTITPLRHVFKEYFPVKGDFVTAANNQRMEVVGRGTVEINVKNGQHGYRLELKDVRHVPGLSTSLISVRALAASGYQCIFQVDTGEIRSFAESGLVIQMKYANGLYQLETIDIGSAYSAESNVLETDIKTAHELLGHANVDILKRMHKRGMNLKLNDLNAIMECDTCLKAKSCIKPHELSASRTPKHPGDIVSADVIDVRAANGHDGFKFVSLIVDHYSYWTSVCVLKEKTASNILDHLKGFNNSLRNTVGKQVKIFRSDRGLEYDNDAMKRYALENQIQLELGVPREPRDNGFAERRIRTIVEATRAMLISAKMNQNFWPYAIDYACYLQNHYLKYFLRNKKSQL